MRAPWESLECHVQWGCGSPSPPGRTGTLLPAPAACTPQRPAHKRLYQRSCSAIIQSRWCRPQISSHHTLSLKQAHCSFRTQQDQASHGSAQRACPVTAEVIGRSGLC